MKPLVALLLLGTLRLAARPIDFAPGLADAARSAWREADGLPQSSVYAVLRSRDGFLWVGTDGGLARFDGLSFRTFHGPGRPLGGRPVTALLETADGSLWIATYGEGVVCLRQGLFRPFRRADGLPAEAVWCLAAGADGDVWAGTVGGGLACLRHGAIRATIDAKRGLPGDTVLALAVSADNTVWAGTDRGLARIDGQAAAPVAIPGGKRHPRITALHATADGGLWVGTVDGLFLLRNGNWRRFDRRDGLPGPFIRALTGDRDARLWAGCDDGLAGRGDDGRFRPFTVADGLTDNAIMAVHADGEGNLWLGTAGGGLMRLRRGAARAWSERQGLPRGQVLAICQDDAGAVWLGSYGAGLRRLRAGRGEQPPELRPLAAAAIYALLPVGDGLLIGSQSGLQRLRNGRLHSVRGLRGQPVTALLGDGGGRWLAGTSGAGLYRVTEEGAAPLAASPGPDRAAVQALLRDRRGTLWVGTYGDGLYARNGDRWRHLGPGDGLPGSSVFALFEAGDGTLWSGGDGGLARLQGDRLQAFGAAAGLPAGTVYSILEAGGRLWLGSHRGIWAVERRELAALESGRLTSLHPLHLDENDGLPSPVCTGGFQPAAWRDRDGLLWFPTMRGAAAVDPHRALARRPPPRLIIEALLADGRVVPPGAVPAVPAGTKRLEIRFSAPDLVQPRTLPLRYRLQGADGAWHETGLRRAVTCDNPAPGRYSLQLACARGGSLATAQLAFTVRPLFHQNRLFRLAAALLAAAALAAGRLLALRRRRAARYRLSTLTSPQARQLEERLRQLMERDKPYLDPDLSLAALAERLEVPVKHLSQVVNDRIGLRFSDFVNQRRVAEARRLLLDPGQRDRKLLAIAFACGFNSKSVFNAAFRKFTGLSPSEFRAGTRT